MEKLAAMKKEEVLLKMARLKLDFEQKQLECYEILVKHSSISLESLDGQKLKVALAQCEVELAELELEGVKK